MIHNARTAMPDVLTVPEVADVLRVDHTTVRRMCDRGSLPGAFRAGRQWRIPRAALPEAVRDSAVATPDASASEATTP